LSVEIETGRYFSKVKKPPWALGLTCREGERDCWSLGRAARPACVGEAGGQGVVDETVRDWMVQCP
jgi:hypothetical protein